MDASADSAGRKPDAAAPRSRTAGRSSEAREALERPALPTQAFIDDSYDDELFVIAGHVAPSEAWAELSEEWARLLPKFGWLSPKTGRYTFKMVEMAKLPERLERVAPFYRLIEKHVTISIAAWLSRADLRRAYSRLYSPTATISFFDKIRPYDLVFGALLDWMNRSQDDILALRDVRPPIDFYFDEQSEKRFLLDHWHQFSGSRQEGFSDFIPNAPRFENDDDFLPLQAADLWAWWVREWIAAGTPEQMNAPDFGPFRAHREGHLKIDFQLTEDTLARALRTAARKTAPHEIIYDVKMHTKNVDSTVEGFGVARISSDRYAS